MIMSQDNWLQKKREEKDNETYFNSESNIQRTLVSMCNGQHKWKKISENEIACTICPTINIVDNPDDYV